jgi:hypothetical protein
MPIRSGCCACVLPSCHILMENSQVDALYECCNKFYERNGDDGSTVSCPKAGTLRYVHLNQNLNHPNISIRLKMKQRAQGIK